MDKREVGTVVDGEYGLGRGVAEEIDDVLVGVGVE